MIGTPLTFKGFIARALISEDTFKRYLGKIDDMRKISQSVVEYLLLVHRGIEMYNGCLIKQCQLLESHINSDMNDDKRYYLQFSMIFQAISINFEHFNCTFESNLKEYHVSTCMELDQLTTSHMDALINTDKKYKMAEDAVQDCAKKWLKQEKQLLQNIKAYNESFVDPRLIYNKQETLKRYLYCEMSYHNVMKEEVNMKEKIAKTFELKKSYIGAHNKFIEEYRKSYEFVHERIILQTKNTLALFCNVHKMVVSDIASKKKAFEETKIKPFLYFIPDISNERHFFNIPTNYKPIDNFPIFLQDTDNIKDAHLKLYSKWLTEYGQFLKDSGENSRRLLKRVHGFLLQTTKTVEKMSSFIIKEVPICYQKVKKRMVQMFGGKTLNFLKSINATLETSMRIYEKLIKVLYQKLEAINSFIVEDQKMGEMFFKEYNKQLDSFNNDTKLLNVNEHKEKIKSAITQKSEIIKHCLTSFGDKLTKNIDLLRVEVKNILHQVFASFNEIFIYSSEYLHNYFGLEFTENLKKIKVDVESISFSLQPISEDLTKQQIEVEESDRFKYPEFQKIKKADSDMPKEGKENKEVGKENKEVADNAANGQEDGPPQRSGNSSSPSKKVSIEIDPKQKKNYDFLSTKVALEEDEHFKHTFKCALYDKILLQGKLYVTDKRLCFHSYFNTANLFFGGTFLQIPKKDIIKAEKRYNAKIFDNSVAIKTVNGEVFFTSFFSRDEAYKEIVQTFGLQVDEPEEAKEDGEKNEDEEKTQAVTDENKQNIQEAEQIPLILTQADDITAEELVTRAEKFQQVTNKKMQKLSVHTIYHANCLYLLKRFFSNQEHTCDAKKYMGFYEYLKESMGEKEIVLENWQPSIEGYLNKSNIKKDTPLRFSRKCRFNHTLPKSGIPFMPKFCKTQQSHRMSIISAQRFIVDFKITSSGAPYADTFIVYTREDYTNVPNGVQITSYLHLEFIKKTMVQSIIEKQSNKDIKQAVEGYVKAINKAILADPTVRKKKAKAKKPSNMNPGSASNQPQQAPEQKLEQVQNIDSQSLEDKYSKLLKEHEDLKKRNILLRYVIIGLVVLNILSLIF